MKTEQYFDVVDAKLIEQSIARYQESEKYKDFDPTLMAKVTGPVVAEVARNFHGLIEDLLKQKIVFCSGNFYRHIYPYLPHTDYKIAEKNTINTVIPLQFNGELPYLMIFDQMWNFDAVTWCLNYPVMKFKINTGVLGSPCQYPIEGMTNKPIDDELYQTYLTHIKQDCLYGLSGNAYKFQPGSIMLFDSRKIHCTAKLTDYKLGLSLRFKFA